jgi:hypothetical protein
MSFEPRTTEELIRIGAAGGGFILNAAPRTTDDLIRIAGATAKSGARLLMRGMSARTTEDLIRIGAAGKGNVQFEA